MRNSPYGITVPFRANATINKFRILSPTSGKSWTIASGTSIDATSTASPPNAIDHWGFQPTGSNVLLATADSPVPGAGNPHYMILPSSGTAGPGASLANSNFFPYIIGPAEFFLTVPGITGLNITNVEVSFGTSPDKTLDATLSSVPLVPEPSTLAIAGLGALGFLGYGLRWRLKK